MGRGKAFEEKVGKLLRDLRTRYPQQVEVSPQYEVTLVSGRRVIIDFKLAVEFPHEIQSYYFELQSRNKHDHALADKVEAIRRDTPLSTFSFIHENALESAVAAELKSRNIVTKNWAGLVRFIEGIELQLLQQQSATRIAGGLPAHDSATHSRLTELVARLTSSKDKIDRRELHGSPPSEEQKRLVAEVIEEVKRDPGEAIRQARRFFGF